MSCDNCPARALLADMLIELSNAPSFMFVVNAGTYSSHTFSFCNRLGMLQKDYEALLVAADLARIKDDSFQVKPKEWMLYLSGWYFDSLDGDRPRLDKKYLDFEHTINGGEKDISRRVNIYSLRIGRHLKSATCQDLTQQLKETHCPPHVYNLRSKQRTFCRTATPAIVHELCNNESLYEEHLQLRKK